VRAVTIGGSVFATVFGGALLGMGLIGTMAALVLSLLISSLSTG
jgi:hypothetical protein